MLVTPVYQAQSQLFVSVQTSDEISGAYTGGLYVQQRIESYVTVVDTPAVLDPVIDELDLDTSYTATGQTGHGAEPERYGTDQRSRLRCRRYAGG